VKLPACLAVLAFAACATPRDAWRVTPPPAHDEPVWFAPTVQAWELPSGLTVMAIEDASLPLESINVAFRAGSAADPRGMEGLANLTFRTWFSSHGTDSRALAPHVQGLGAHAVLDVSPDGAIAGATIAAERTEGVVALLADHLVHPTIEPEVLVPARDEALHDLSLATIDLQSVANRAMAAEVYGRDHPYGRPVEGLRSFVDRAQLSDLTNFFQDHVAPNTTALIFAGSVPATAALALVQKYLAGWTGKALVPEVPSAPPPTARMGIVFIPRPGATQSLITLGRAGAPSGSPDEIPLLLANRVFGGLLTKEFREDTSWTYDVDANASMTSEAGLVITSASVRSDVTGEALRNAVWTAQRMGRQVDWERALPSAREDLARSTFAWLNTLQQRAAAAATLFWGRQPADRYQRLIRGAFAEPAWRVQAVANRYFDPRWLHIVVVGDPEVYTRQIANLDLAAPPPSLGADSLVHARAEYEKGVQLIREKNYNEALRALNTAIQLWPTFTDAYLARGSAQVGVGRYAGAVADYQYAQSLDPNRAGPLYGLAEAFRALGRKAEAADAYRRYAASNAPDARPDLQADARRKEQECSAP
jgi:zinc protease